jgi:hypothetical protein
MMNGGSRLQMLNYIVNTLISMKHVYNYAMMRLKRLISFPNSGGVPVTMIFTSDLCNTSRMRDTRESRV